MSMLSGSRWSDLAPSRHRGGNCGEWACDCLLLLTVVLSISQQLQKLQDGDRCGSPAVSGPILLLFERRCLSLCYRQRLPDRSLVPVYYPARSRDVVSPHADLPRFSTAGHSTCCWRGFDPRGERPPTPWDRSHAHTSFPRVSWLGDRRRFAGRVPIWIMIFGVPAAEGPDTMGTMTGDTLGSACCSHSAP
jgi:hypothetical protein